MPTTDDHDEYAEELEPAEELIHAVQRAAEHAVADRLERLQRELAGLHDDLEGRLDTLEAHHPHAADALGIKAAQERLERAFRERLAAEGQAWERASRLEITVNGFDNRLELVERQLAGDLERYMRGHDEAHSAIATTLARQDTAIGNAGAALARAARRHAEEVGPLAPRIEKLERRVEAIENGGFEREPADPGPPPGPELAALVHAARGASTALPWRGDLQAALVPFRHVP